MNRDTLSLKHASLSNPPSNLIDGAWHSLSGAAAGTLIESRNPARPDLIVWSGKANAAAIEGAVGAAQRALPAWAKWGRDNRFKALRKFAELCKLHQQRIAELICDETGKVMWEAKGEAAALAAKVDITLDTSVQGGLARVNGFEFEMGSGAGAQKTAKCWFKAHGVMAVLGPFNFPAHLPNGHIVPALAMGNTVVFKPSDKAPGVGQLLAELLNEALAVSGAPNNGRGIVNLVQGGADIASALVAHPGTNGILFTGSWPVGRRILEANLDHPGRIVALELGGNNPVIVMDDADIKQAVIEIVRCAFNTTGQRCTSTRRVIVHHLAANRLVEAVTKATQKLVIADPRSTTPTFMGPIISDAARQAVFDFQSRCEKAGAEVLVESKPLDIKPAGRSVGGGYYLSPAIIRVERFSLASFDPKDKAGSFDPGCDHEVFGPLLRICEARDLSDAIAQANATRYGLAASIFTKSQGSAERFLFETSAGCLNVNTGTAGASSKLPFGGTGLSGNHRPAGSFSLDYCAYPVAGMIERGETAQLAEGMKWEDGWVK